VSRSQGGAGAPGRTRVERDALGPVEVPADRYWGAQTQRAVEHFAIGAQRWPRPFLRALGLIKLASARVNAELGLLPRDKAGWIASAAEEVVSGRLDEHFPLVLWQSGSGTQTNMNANEVIANRASELGGGGPGSHLVHPNDDVNRCQSSNDVIPTALHLAAAEEVARRLLPALAGLRQALEAKSRATADVVKLGRTHLQDATPLTLGQELSGHAAQLAICERALESALPGVELLALGGTAVGTGLNAHPEFASRAIAQLALLTDLPFSGAPNKFAALAGADALVVLHGALKALAGALTKLAEDLRWLASGPRGGLGELRLPANEPGSSIMPGKINPTQCESLLMVCMQVLANDLAVALAARAANFELNTARPLLARALLESVALLADGCESFRRHCVEGLEPDRERIRALLERSLMLVTALAPSIGYDAAAEIAQRAHREGTTLREAALASGRVTAQEFDAIVDARRMTEPGILDG
jgi:fumarate hydratase class II